MSTLQLKHIDKRFGDTVVLRDIDLEAAEGEFVALVGPSGCGKSTLLRIISGLEPTTAGEIILDGKRVNDVSAAERGLAMVFQSYALYPHMTVYQNMAFGLENTGTPKAEIERKIGDAARMLQLDVLLQRRPTQLSGGQRQRVAIGRAIVRNPKLFLFDEPLSNLDAELRVQMRAEIIALHQRLKTGMIYVTHDQVEAMTMADKIVVLRAGQVEQTGTPLELYNSPQNRFVAGFIGSPRMNFIEAVVTARDGRGLTLALAGFEPQATINVAVDPAAAAHGTAVMLGVRPEHLEVAEGAGAPDTVTVQIAQVEQLGGHGFIHCTLPTSKRSLVVQFQGQIASRAGATVTLRIPPAACHVFSTAAGEPALPPLHGAG
ncbi:MAG: ABC transporter ATP-binding protein [Betaproteobacteria bacterium]|nr:ABC transporter ATP-binding protein [Betaproteobacteria bacterium]